MLLYTRKYRGCEDDNIGRSARLVGILSRSSIGGRNLASYDVKSVSILIHHNQNANETEKRANYLFNQILKAENVVIGDTPIQMIRLLSNEPIDVGTDDNNVYERVIELDIYYRLEQESEE